MGQQSNETIDAFLASLKAAGVRISNEAELRERLVEARRWHTAFVTLAAHGQPLGIRFEGDAAALDAGALQTLFAQHQFPAHVECSFSAGLRARH